MAKVSIGKSSKHIGAFVKGKKVLAGGSVARDDRGIYGGVGATLGDKPGKRTSIGSAVRVGKLSSGGYGTSLKGTVMRGNKSVTLVKEASIKLPKKPEKRTPTYKKGYGRGR